MDETVLATGSNAPARDATIEAAIGAQVKALRLARGQTLADLAASAGISAGTLSKIENGVISPSLGTLDALARALVVPLTALLAKYEETRDVSHVKAGEGVVIERRGSKAGHRYELLGKGLSGALRVEPFLITLAEGAEPYATFAHEGAEFIFMLEGRLGYRHGERVFEMEPGDAMLFDPAAPHGPERLDALPARFLSVIIWQEG